MSNLNFNTKTGMLVIKKKLLERGFICYSQNSHSYYFRYPDVQFRLRVSDHMRKLSDDIVYSGVLKIPMSAKELEIEANKYINHYITEVKKRMQK